MNSKPRTKRISNFLEDERELYFDNHNNVTLVVTKLHSFQTISGGDEYVISSHQGRMPAFHEETHTTLEALAVAMKAHADLRRWKVIPYENYS